MKDVIYWIIIAVSSYLLGSLNSSIIISKLFLHKDIREYGSGNAGLTNSYRTMGAGKTLLVLIGDIAKGVIAVSIGIFLGVPLGNVMMGKLVAAIFVIVGHVFPLYFGFRGGKGILVGATALFMLDYRMFLIAFALFVAAVALTRWVSLGSILGAISFPITMFCFYREIVTTVIAVVLAAVVIYMHRSNIGRICKGTENKFSFKSNKIIDRGSEGGKE